MEIISGFDFLEGSYKTATVAVAELKCIVKETWGQETEAYNQIIKL